MLNGCPGGPATGGFVCVLGNMLEESKLGIASGVHTYEHCDSSAPLLLCSSAPLLLCSSAHCHSVDTDPQPPIYDTHLECCRYLKNSTEQGPPEETHMAAFMLARTDNWYTHKYITCMRCLCLPVPLQAVPVVHPQVMQVLFRLHRLVGQRFQVEPSLRLRWQVRRRLRAGNDD